MKYSRFTAKLWQKKAPPPGQAETRLKGEFGEAGYFTVMVMVFDWAARLFQEALSLT
jgi:hypothetical protein